MAGVKDQLPQNAEELWVVHSLCPSRNVLASRGESAHRDDLGREGFSLSHLWPKEYQFLRERRCMIKSIPKCGLCMSLDPAVKPHGDIVSVGINCVSAWACVAYQKHPNCPSALEPRTHEYIEAVKVPFSIENGHVDQ